MKKKVMAFINGFLDLIYKPKTDYCHDKNRYQGRAPRLPKKKLEKM